MPSKRCEFNSSSIKYIFCSNLGFEADALM